LQSESCKEFVPDFIASFAVDVDDFIIGYFGFPLRERMEISHIKLEEISIGFAFHHDDLVDEEYLG